MQITVKKKEVFPAYEALQRLEKMSLARNLAYAVEKNKAHVESEVKAIQAAQRFADTESAAFKAYETKRKELAEKYAERDDTGRRIENRQGIRLANPIAYEQELEAWLDSDMPLLKVAFVRHEKEVKELLETDTQIEIHDMRLEDFPVEFRPEVLGIPVVHWIVV
jgi:hypothetical protein